MAMAVKSRAPSLTALNSAVRSAQLVSPKPVSYTHLELTPGKDGMLHISKMADHRVEKVEDVMNIGDEVEVKVNEIDSQGRVNLIRNDITYSSGEGSSRSFSGERRRPPRRDGRPSGGSDRN